MYVYLSRRRLQLPGTVHAVFTPTTSICTGVHYTYFEALPRVLTTIVTQHYLSQSITNADQAASVFEHVLVLAEHHFQGEKGFDNEIFAIVEADEHHRRCLAALVCLVLFGSYLFSPTKSSSALEFTQRTMVARLVMWLDLWKERCPNPGAADLWEREIFSFTGDLAWHRAYARSDHIHGEVSASFNLPLPGGTIHQRAHTAWRYFTLALAVVLSCFNYDLRDTPRSLPSTPPHGVDPDEYREDDIASLLKEVPKEVARAIPRSFSPLPGSLFYSKTSTRNQEQASPTPSPPPSPKEDKHLLPSPQRVGEEQFSHIMKAIIPTANAQQRREILKHLELTPDQKKRVQDYMRNRR